MTDLEKLPNYYQSLKANERAKQACEMAEEIMAHYDGARALVTALLRELDEFGHEAIQLKQLTEVLNSWVTNAENSDQELRLLACLVASRTA